MTTITIPGELTNDRSLVAIPRGTYEEFLVWQKNVKSMKTFKPTPSEKRAMARGRKNFSQGKWIGLKELKHELGINR